MRVTTKGQVTIPLAIREKLGSYRQQRSISLKKTVGSTW